MERRCFFFGRLNNSSSLLVISFFLLFFWPCVVHPRYSIDDSSSEEIWGSSKEKGNGNGTDVGLTPPVFNLARHASILSNGTCGENGDETYCKLTEHVHDRPPRPSQCQVCSADSPDKTKRHPIRYAIDESNRWWQSPTLANGRHYEWITITIDLKKVYQVAYIIIKAAISPRPGNWILERSKDGIDYFPWQYFATSDDECLSWYGIPAKPGKPSYSEDDEVICTSYFSKITPFEGGEIHTSLINGRPGAETMSEKLTKFTMARFIRLRLQKIRTLHGDLMAVGGPGDRAWDSTVTRRYFYSIKDIAIGGTCVCFGHASECVVSDDGSSPTAKCMCQHNTCGDSCDVCCPLFNQYEWGAGNSTDSAACEQCQCYGHADSCVYDPKVHEERRSINIFGTYDGGGVCLDCKDHTTGINCERCQDGYYRPQGVHQDDHTPCIKCNCSSIGSEGYCVPDEIQGALLAKSSGDCICKEGFAGRHCDKCARGYRNYPTCEPCLCNLSGIRNLDCRGDCACKENVEGVLCNACKKGFFNLEEENPAGCTQCFCHGVASSCTSSNFPIVQINGTGRWLVTDLHGTKILPATQFGDSHHYVANEDFASFSQYYWTLEEGFSGKEIHSYGLNITFMVSWVRARGDTSGRPIPEFDIIIQGTSSMLAFSHKFYEGNNATISVVLNEFNCFVLPDVDNSVLHRNGISGHPGTPCTRYEVMEGLSDIKQVLLRAKFHTDQIEGILHYATFESANPKHAGIPASGRVASSVEICSCPPGYTGSSCEECAYSYRKSSKDSWLNECVKCDCNGHSLTCGFDGKCEGCEHNTTGETCDTCLAGFYGDPKTELPHACKPCECPLSVESNNFSPTCSLSGGSYICTACAEGYEGPFCERCSNGFYGNPTQEGDTCKPCNCNLDLNTENDGDASICDHLTGECLLCPKNTVGWNCDECLSGHFGDPLNGTCIPCECNLDGSLNGDCDPVSGQCYCKEFFQGLKCEICVEGHGGMSDGCPACSCNPIGSNSTVCDPGSGQCPCKPGVDGRFCNKCLVSHYGFGFGGCTSCGCDQNGSDSEVCDLKTGQCHCLPNVVGRRCESCSVGYWNLESGSGCDSCDCDPVGSIDLVCDRLSGQCPCKPGVGGARCDQCLPMFYGFFNQGCKECDPCDKAGHICDPNDGRCVCPPNTEGSACEKCQVGFWGHSLEGCKECNCSQQGSSTRQCVPETGKCPCLPAYEGDKCQICKFGYYNYPMCTPCECDSAGTEGEYCDERGICSCNESGDCSCKENVAGKKCDRCKDGTYGLEVENPSGCMQCFCFQRTNRCSQGYFKWQRLAMLNRQNLVVKRTLTGGPSHIFMPYFDGHTHCYINLALPTERNIAITRGSGEKHLKSVNKLLVIPDLSETIYIENDVSFGAPLYWQLPHIFLGDKVLSYNGYLRFHVGSSSPSAPFHPQVLSSYPLVQIQGNYKLILEHFPETPATNGFFEVRLHEDQWRLRNGPNNGNVSKETMMVALQNLQHILIRATTAPDVFNVTLFNVSLDIAIPSNYADNSMAHGIEVCECPAEYNSTSCQNPKLGYYRWYKREYITSTIIIDLIGQAKPCECNGRANICDTESGHCLNCTGNTGGPHCETCAEGYYGDPEDECLPCPCPVPDNNHANACFQYSDDTRQFQCFCKEGYTGKTCDRCDYGFFGLAGAQGGTCERCKCNPYGSVSDECHEITGQCNCRPGVTGRDCSQCKHRHVIIGKTCSNCDDQCTGLLLNQVENMTRYLQNIQPSSDAAAVWRKLVVVEKLVGNLANQVLGLKTTAIFLDNLPTYSNLARIFRIRMRELEELSLNKVIKSSEQMSSKSMSLLNALRATMSELRTVVHNLDAYHNEAISTVDSEVAKAEAQDHVNALQAVEFVQSKIAVEMELEEAVSALDRVTSLMVDPTLVDAVLTELEELKGRLEDVKHHLNRVDALVGQARSITLQGERIYLRERENLELVNNVSISNDIDSLMAADKISEGNFVLTEITQVFQMIEDMLDDLRNATKEMQLRDNAFHNLISTNRVKYAQPAFEHVHQLKSRAREIQRRLHALSVGGSEPLNVVSAYRRIVADFEMALNSAANAVETGAEAAREIQVVVNSDEYAQLGAKSADLVAEGLRLSAVISNDLRRRCGHVRSSLNQLKRKINAGNETLRDAFNQMEQYDRNLRLDELTNRVEDVDNLARNTFQEIMDIDRELEIIRNNIEAVGGGASPSSIGVMNQLSTIRRSVDSAKTVAGRVEKEKSSLKIKEENSEMTMRRLRALLMQSRHKSDTVRVALGPDVNGTCFRLYRWPVIEEATSIRFNFAPTRSADSLLFYWPSSLNDDYIAIQMTGLKINASWQLGSGLRSLAHPWHWNDAHIADNAQKVKAGGGGRVDTLEPLDPDHWVQVSFERVGSWVSLDVRPQGSTGSNHLGAITYQHSEEEATLLNLSADDLIHVGGMSRIMRPGLVPNGLSGCIHNLVVNHRALGLWNYVGNEGCQPCVECPDDTETVIPSSDEEYYFDGRGYVLVNRIEARAFNPKFFELNMEFKTYSETALLFLTINERNGQFISVELRDGGVVMQIMHSYSSQSDALYIQSEGGKYNTGNWISLRAVWVYQQGRQTGQLTIGRSNFKEEKASKGHSLDMYDAAYQIGGLTPTFNPRKLEGKVTLIPFVGCMKNILIDGSSYDLMSGLHFGIQSSCSGKEIHVISFEGNGYSEYNSQPMTKDFLLGFSFKTLSSSGVLVVSTSAKQSSRSPAEPYYAIYLENGQIRVQFGIPHGPIEIANNTVRYNDGKVHAFRLVKKSRRVIIFMDDVELGDTRLPKKYPMVPAPTEGGLFIGGLSEYVREQFEETFLKVTRGIAGCIQNLFFGQSLLNFNYPVTYANQNLGQCPTHFHGEQAEMPLTLTYPGAVEFPGGSYERRYVDHSCRPTDPVIEQEDPEVAVHFGDHPDSHLSVVLDRSKSLRQNFNLTFEFRTFYPSGLLFKGTKHKGNGSHCLSVALKDGQIMVRVLADRQQDLMSSVSTLNDGLWHHVTLVRAEDKMYLYVDSLNATVTKVPKMKAITKLEIGGSPSDSFDCFQSHKPDNFKGCVKNIFLNTSPFYFDSRTLERSHVSSCFRHIQAGSFFQMGSYAIYSHNFTLGNLIELELEFKSDARHGILLSFHTNRPLNYPAFSIFLDNGKVVARESFGAEEFNEAVQEFEDSSFVCDGEWHSLKANYENGAITLRIDNMPPRYAVVDPPGRHPEGFSWSSSISGSLYIGGGEEMNSRSKRNQFHGCIRNIAINRHRRDWTDMAHLQNVFLNACPL